MSLPILTTPDGKATGDSVLLAVYAPFGTDETLSGFPDDTTHSVDTHPLVTSLKQVALAGVHVVALVDRVDDFTWLIEIAAGTTEVVKTSRWKQDMSSARNLAGFLVHAWQRHPKSTMVLALEGHGAGYLPEIDRRQQTPMRVTDGGKFEWHFSDTDAAPVLPGGFPVLPGGFPVLPGGFPVLPVNHMPVSTWGIGQALSLARGLGAPRPAVIHFNNCFNMSVEVLHTVRQHADYATGYCNYNFFTSGAAYPAVFQQLKTQGHATGRELATWFGQQNHAQLLPKKNHPTVAGVIDLARMDGIADGVDKLSDAMRVQLQGLVGSARQALINVIRQAIFDAQQYDSEPGWNLEAPDQLTDLYSLAATLGKEAGAYPSIRDAANNLAKLLTGIKLYGDNDTPWLDATASIRWDFSADALAMNIFLPDPLRDGLWDWRSPYYVDNNPAQDPPPIQPGVIDFLKDTGWVDFLIEYHKDVPFRAFHVGNIPPLPVFNQKYQGPRGNPPDCGTPRKPWPLGPIARRLIEWLARHADQG